MIFFSTLFSTNIRDLGNYREFFLFVTDSGIIRVFSKFNIRSLPSKKFTPLTFFLLKETGKWRRKKLDSISPVNGVFPCLNNCGRVYKHKRSMMSHFKLECCGVAQFTCHICQRSFCQKASMRRHLMGVHSAMCE